ncbi:MAG: hypothetical protein JNM18_23495 [Planctomycetaceae bacterium]|nr:hypothetical protein [Planctomycetaceae bacterium]
MTEEQYREKVRTGLLALRSDAQTGFLDTPGFIVDYTGGKPDTLGEGTLHTAIAAVALATGNYRQDAWEKASANQNLSELLDSLRNGGGQDGLSPAALPMRQFIV